MSKPILYTTGCPRCKVLGAKLDAKGIEYDIETDIDVMEKLGIQTAPTLCVDGQMMDFGTANTWVNSK